MSSKRLVIVGLAPFVVEAAGVARENEPDRDISTLVLPVEDRFKFDMASLDALDPGECDAFVALDQRALNFSRLELVSILKARGFSLARLISKRALVDPNHRFGENTIVHVGAAISGDARIGYNVVIGPGCTVGSGARLGNSVYLAAGAVVGAASIVGDGTTVSSGSIVSAGVKVGKQCELGIARTYENDVPDKTFFSREYDGPVRILKF